jgi:hypothetical protein
MEKSIIYTHEKYVGSVCMIILCISGIILLWINSWQNAQSSSYEHLQKTKLLWKFEPSSFLSVHAIAILKLFCAGIMVSSLVTSILVKLFSFIVAISSGIFLLISWIIGLVFVWKYYFSVSLQATTKAEHKSEAWKIRTRSKDDARLPITIVTGYLGEKLLVNFPCSMSTAF